MGPDNLTSKNKMEVRLGWVRLNYVNLKYVKLNKLKLG